MKMKLPVIVPFAEKQEVQMGLRLLSSALDLSEMNISEENEFLPEINYIKIGSTQDEEFELAMFYSPKVLGKTLNFKNDEKEIVKMVANVLIENITRDSPNCNIQQLQFIVPKYIDGIFKTQEHKDVIDSLLSQWEQSQASKPTVSEKPAPKSFKP